MDNVKMNQGLKFHASRLKYLFPYFVVLLLLLLSGYSYYYTGQFLLPLIIFGIAVVMFSALEMLIRLHRITLEQSQIVYEEGILSRKSVTTHYAAVVDVIVTQTIMQRILGIGDIRIKTPAAAVKEIILSSFPKLRFIENYIKKKVHVHKSGRV